MEVPEKVKCCNGIDLVFAGERVGWFMELEAEPRPNGEANVERADLEIRSGEKTSGVARDASHD